MKILHIVPDTAIASGVMSAVMGWYREIDKKSIQFDFLPCFEVEKNYEKEIQIMGGKVHKLGDISLLNIIEYRKILRELFKKNNYQIIHSHVPNLSFIYFDIAKKYGTEKLILHSHSTKYSSSKIKSMRNYVTCKLALNKADVYWACSKKAGEFLYGSQRDFSVIKNSINYKEFKFNSKKRILIRNKMNLCDKTVFGHVGRMEKEKNHEFLINIFEKIHKKDKNTLLILVGDGSLKQRLISLVKDKKIENSVIFLGVRNDIADLMQGMDSIIFPSEFEGLGITLVEAQVNGLPVFGSSNIPKEVDISKSVSFIDLSKSSDEWANQILNEIKYKERIEKEFEENNEYDSLEVSKDLKTNYERLVR